MKYYLLFSLIILAVGLGLLVGWKGRNPRETFSQKAATSIASIFFYIALFSITLPLLYSYFVNWLQPEYQLGGVFWWLMVVSLVTQWLCTLVPERGQFVFAHRVLTGISGILLIPILALVMFSPVTNLLAQTICLIGITIMVLLLRAGLQAQKRGHHYALLLQVGYYAAFFIPVMFITYG